MNNVFARRGEPAGFFEGFFKCDRPARSAIGNQNSGDMAKQLDDAWELAFLLCSDYLPSPLAPYASFHDHVEMLCLSFAIGINFSRF
jgi:hypothetical protein